jgi:hypothetical protein
LQIVGLKAAGNVAASSGASAGPLAPLNSGIRRVWEMGVTYRFIADPQEPSHVLKWFGSLESPPKQITKEWGAWLFFREMGPFSRKIDGSIDVEKSPLVLVVLPVRKRGVLWTVGEVHIRATPLRKVFPELNAVKARFLNWLRSFECVFSGESECRVEWDYHLEGSVRNYDAPIFASPSGLSALRSGQYFVSDDDNDLVLEDLCRSLRLRGVQCDAV